MSTYTLFDDLQDQAATEAFLAREAARHQDLQRRALEPVQTLLQEDGIDTTAWENSTYQDLLASSQSFSETFQVKFPALATWLANCGFKFAGMFFAPMLLVTDLDATDEIMSLMADGTSVVY